MEGRWTIRRCACSVSTVDEVGPPLPTPCEREGKAELIPVVPCDDAAIERGVRALDSFSDLAIVEGSHRAPRHDELREWAEAVLRAAGETP